MPTGLPHVLIPFNLREAMSVGEAATVAGRSKVTIRCWAAENDLGRRVGGRWLLSRVALAMHLESDWRALRAYLDGDRTSPVVVGYFERFGLIPRKETTESVEKENTERNDMVSAEE